VVNASQGRETAPQGSQRIALSPQVSNATRQYLDLHLKPLREAAARGEGGMSHAQRVARVFDGLISSYFLAACARLPQEGAKLPSRIALVAVGGYGRGTLGLGSDLDIVLLVPDANDPNAHALADTLLYPLWDAGVSIGHSVRTPDELVSLARQDLRTATTLLDARVLAGEGSFANEAIERGWRALFDRDLNAFLDSMIDEMTSRHGRYGASVYLLEPDLKQGRGALRDLDIARWALRSRFRTHDFADALKLGAISQHDAPQLEAAREFFWRARGVLHAKSNRRSDRLTFDEQEECARALGFVVRDEESVDPLRAVGAAAERFMQTYYRHARTVATTLDRLIESCRVQRDSRDRMPRTDRVAEGIERFEGTLSFSDPDALQRDPTLALRIVERALALGIPLHARARDVIAQSARDPSFADALRASPQSGPLFSRLLTHSAPATLRTRGVPVSATEQGATSVLAELHDLGLLLALVPEFGPVTGRVHHDIYHVYTVDVHSVAAVDRLHQIARGEMREEFALAAHTLADLERRDLLTLATLLHDVGKGRGGDHSAVGAELARPIARRMGLDDEEAGQVAWLVQQHLALYHFATRRDLGDPATLAQITSLVGTSWRLRALYLLTVADLSTTSPTAMNSWKARMLDEVLRRTEEALGGVTNAGHAHADELERRAIALASEKERPGVTRFLATMPRRYVLATPAASVARHARVVAQAKAGEPLVHIAPLEGSSGDLAEVVIVAPDRPGLLARLAGMLYMNRLDVQGAQVYSREMPYGVDAVDVFTVRRLDDDPGALLRLATKLPRDLVALLESDAAFEKVMASRAHTGIPRPEPAVRSEVEIDNHASDRFTVIEVFGRDRPGLLYAVAKAIYELGLSISLSKVNTEGRRVADVFYVTEQGAKLSEKRFAEIRERLVTAVTEGR
jgi:[protein-PII] uridylyltransferase